MRSIRKINPVLRATGIISAVTILATGVTYAALQSQATLTDNTISTTTAGLQVKSSGADFSDSDAGFQFTNLTPGAGYGTAQPFSLKNSGSADLTVTAQAEAVTPTGGSVDKELVFVKFTNVTNGATVEYTLKSLETAPRALPGVTTVDPLSNGETDDFTVAVKIADNAVTGSSATISNFDITLSGSTFVAPTAE